MLSIKKGHCKRPNDSVYLRKAQADTIFKIRKQDREIRPFPKE